MAAKPTSIRVKVKVRDLLAAVREAREAAVKENGKAQADEVKRFEEWRKKAIRAIEAQDITKYDQIPNWSPARMDTLGTFDRDIRLLEMCADDEMVLTGSSDFVRYL